LNRGTDSYQQAHLGGGSKEPKCWVLKERKKEQAAENTECFTYQPKDGAETILVSKATHSSIYDVVRYLVKEKKMIQPIKHGTPDFIQARDTIRKRKKAKKEKQQRYGLALGGI
jgi:hypothetical protein